MSTDSLFFEGYAASVIEAIKDAGVDLRDREERLHEFLAAEVEKLALAIGEPGYGLVLQAAKDAALLAAGVAAVDAADSVDSATTRGIIFGALSAAARLL